MKYSDDEKDREILKIFNNMLKEGHEGKVTGMIGYEVNFFKGGIRNHFEINRIEKSNKK